MTDINSSLVVLLETAHAVMFDGESDSDDDTPMRRKVTKVSMYAENVVQLMNDATFKARFRISRYTMDALVMDLSRRLVDCGSVGHPSIDPRKQVLMTVYTLAHQCSYRYTC